MWIKTEPGDLVQSRYVRRFAVREAQAVRETSDGTSTTTRPYIPACGHVMVAYSSGGVTVVAHRETAGECEAVLEALRSALQADEKTFVVKSGN